MLHEWSKLLIWGPASFAWECGLRLAGDLLNALRCTQCPPTVSSASTLVDEHGGNHLETRRGGEQIRGLERGIHVELHRENMLRTDRDTHTHTPCVSSWPSHRQALPAPLPPQPLVLPLLTLLALLLLLLPQPPALVILPRSRPPLPLWARSAASGPVGGGVARSSERNTPPSNANAGVSGNSPLKYSCESIKRRPTSTVP